MATIELTDIQKRNLEILVMDARYLNKVRKHSLSDIEIEELIPLVLEIKDADPIYPEPQGEPSY